VHCADVKSRGRSRFNFDCDSIDGQTAMGKFMCPCVTEPSVAKLPFMIDSSKWPVIEEGLKWVQGKSTVNSISLKVGVRSACQALLALLCCSRADVAS